MLDLVFWAPVLVAGLVAGASSGLLSVYIVGMRVPFLGICISHAALAGAVFGALFGLQGQALMLPALGASVLTALALGLASPNRVRMDDNIVMGLLLSLTMGLAFLGFGLFGVFGRSDNEVRSLLWGSLTFCGWDDVLWMCISAGALVFFVLLFGKEMRAILFSRVDAEACGVRVGLIWPIFLVLAAMLLTVNFQTVGGLMIYSLITNPAAAAFQLTRSVNRAMLLSILLGAISGFGGFLLSAWTDLPSGAVIVLLSSLLVALAAGWRYLRRN